MVIEDVTTKESAKGVYKSMPLSSGHFAIGVDTNLPEGMGVAGSSYNDDCAYLPFSIVSRVDDAVMV